MNTAAREAPGQDADHRGHLGGTKGGGEGARATRSVPSTGRGSSLTAGKPPSDSSPPRRAEHRHTGCRRRALPTPSTRLQAPAAQRGPGGGGATEGSRLPAPSLPLSLPRATAAPRGPAPAAPDGRPAGGTSGCYGDGERRGGEGGEGKGAGSRVSWQVWGPGIGTAPRAGGRWEGRGGSCCPAERRKRGEERAHTAGIRCQCRPGGERYKEARRARLGLEECVCVCVCERV